MRFNDNWWLGIFTAGAIVVSVVGGVAAQHQRADAASLADAQKRALAARAAAKRLASNEATTTRVVSVVTTTEAGDGTTGATTTTTTSSSSSATTATKKKTTKAKKKSGTPSTAVTVAAAVGDDVRLGTFNGSTITWRILSLDSKRIVLISEQVLEAGPYQSSESANAMNDYASSSVRSWLNDTFVPAVFGSDAESNATLGRSSASDAIAGDIAYLLTPSELSRYLPDADDRVAGSTTWSQGNAGYGGASLAAGPAYWWLAPDPDTDASAAAPVVQANGAINVHRYAAIASDGVRPCIRLVPSALKLTAVAGLSGVYTVTAK